MSEGSFRVATASFGAEGQLALVEHSLLMSHTATQLPVADALQPEMSILGSIGDHARQAGCQSSSFSTNRLRCPLTDMASVWASFLARQW
jgi:hypothetical protein